MTSMGYEHVLKKLSSLKDIRTGLLYLELNNQYHQEDSLSHILVQQPHKYKYLHFQQHMGLLVAHHIESINEVDGDNQHK